MNPVAPVTSPPAIGLFAVAAVSPVTGISRTDSETNSIGSLVLEAPTTAVTIAFPLAVPIVTPFSSANASLAVG